MLVGAAFEERDLGDAPEDAGHEPEAVAMSQSQKPLAMSQKTLAMSQQKTGPEVIRPSSMGEQVVVDYDVQVFESRTKERPKVRAPDMAPRSSGALKLGPTPAMDPHSEAHARTEARSKLFAHLALLASVVLFMAFAADLEAATTIGLLWTIFISRRIYRVLVAPKFERRWYEEELEFQRAKARIGAPQQEQSSKNLEMLSASIAHEIRNPITAAKSLVQQMVEDPSAAENAEYGRVVIEELDRVERSISHLLRFAKEEPLDLVEIELSEVVDSALETCRERLSRENVRIIRRHDAPAWLSGDAEKLRRILINLVTNALDAMEEAKLRAPEIQIATGVNLAGSQAWLSVRDNGPGIEEDRLRRVFSPFYTSKPTGTGLGLAIAKKLAESHGGSLELNSEVGRYTELLLFLPRGARGGIE